jgi:hypothetical protein
MISIFAWSMAELCRKVARSIRSRELMAVPTGFSPGGDEPETSRNAVLLEGKRKVLIKEQQNTRNTNNHRIIATTTVNGMCSS